MITFAISFVYYVVFLIRRGKRDEVVTKFIFITILAVSFILSFVYFNIKMPYACTQDFRYIMPLILVFACMIGAMESKREEMGRFGKVIGRTLSVTVISLLACMSTMFFLYA